MLSPLIPFVFFPSKNCVGSGYIYIFIGFYFSFIIYILCPRKRVFISPNPIKKFPPPIHPPHLVTHHFPFLHLRQLLASLTSRDERDDGSRSCCLPWRPRLLPPAPPPSPPAACPSPSPPPPPLVAASPPLCRSPRL
jgi:hypothetical protein